MSDCRHILLLADIHANETALVAAVCDARKRYQRCGPLRIWFLGDLFGRGPAPAETWRRFMAYRPGLAIAGNHDWGIIGKERIIRTAGRWDGFFNKYDWKIILAHRVELTDVGLLYLVGDEEPRSGQVFEYLKNLPVLCSPCPGVYLVHGGWGTPQKPQVERHLNYLVWDYVTRPEDAQLTLSALTWIAEHPSDISELAVSGNSLEAPRVVLVGHYHRRTLYRGSLGGFEWEDRVRLDYTYELDPQPERPVLISPGSVGFPREYHDRDASYAMLCLRENTVCSVTFHKVPFDRAIVRAQMGEKEYPQEIIRHLQMRDDTQVGRRKSACAQY